MTTVAAKGFLDAWGRAHAARDVGDLVSLYAPDALFFGSAPGLARGHAEIRDYFERLAPHEEPAVDFEIVATHVVADGVVEIASVGTFRWRGNPGVRIRFTHTLVERGGCWLAASHHASPE